MTPKFMRNLHNHRRMKYRIKWENVAMTIFIVGVLLTAYLFVAWIDESAELAKKEGLISEREHQIVALLQEVPVHTGDGDYVICRKTSLIKGI